MTGNKCVGPVKIDDFFTVGKKQNIFSDQISLRGSLKRLQHRLQDINLTFITHKMYL